MFCQNPRKEIRFLAISNHFKMKTLIIWGNFTVLNMAYWKLVQKARFLEVMPDKLLQYYKTLVEGIGSKGYYTPPLLQYGYVYVKLRTSANWFWVSYYSGVSGQSWQSKRFDQKPSVLFSWEMLESMIRKTGMKM